MMKYDNSAHFKACEEDVLRRIELLKEGDVDHYSFWICSRDFWLALCIGYFTMSKEYVAISNSRSVFKRFPAEVKEFIDNLFDSDALERVAVYTNVDDVSFKSSLNFSRDGGKWNKIRLSRNFIDHGAAKIDLSINSDNLIFHDRRSNNEIECNIKDTTLPINWLVSYTEAFCNGKFFADETNFVTGNKIVDTLANLYRLYTSSFNLFITQYNVPELTKQMFGANTEEEQNELCEKLRNNIRQSGVAKDEESVEVIFNSINLPGVIELKKFIEENSTEVINSLLYVAGINMYVLNYEGNFKDKINNISTDDLEGQKLLALMSDETRINFHRVKSYPNKRCHDTIRNCFSHPGRITVLKEDDNKYMVELQDKDNNGRPSGHVSVELDTLIDYLKHPFFKKQMGCSNATSDSISRTQEIETMLQEASSSSNPNLFNNKISK